MDLVSVKQWRRIHHARKGGSDFTLPSLQELWMPRFWKSGRMLAVCFTANPKSLNKRFHRRTISYQEAMELSHFGAMGITRHHTAGLDKHSHSHQNTFDPWIGRYANFRKYQIMKRARKRNQSPYQHCLIDTGRGRNGRNSWFSKRLFEALASKSINVILITQASSEHSILCGASRKGNTNGGTDHQCSLAYEISLGKIDPVMVEKGLGHHRCYWRSNEKSSRH